MKRLSLLLFLTFAMSLNMTSGQEATKAHRDSLNAVVDQYYALNLKVFQANSTPSDVDHIFQLFTDDFTYVHPKYGGTYTREDLYNGYLNNQKKGSYDGDVIDIKKENQITGLNAVVVQKRFVSKSENGPEEGELNMTLFEFKDGKIHKIFEYW